MGGRLLHRSSRRLTITPAGEQILHKTRALARLADEIEQQGDEGKPQGTLRVACAHSTATHSWTDDSGVPRALPGGAY